VARVILPPDHCELGICLGHHGHVADHLALADEGLDWVEHERGCPPAHPFRDQGGFRRCGPFVGSLRILVLDEVGPIERILILRGGALGDFLLSLPAIEAIHQVYPNAEIELHAESRIGSLIPRLPFIKRFQDINGPLIAGLLAGRDCSSDVSRFDLALSFLSDPDETLRSALLHSGVGEVIQCLARPDDREMRSAYLLYAEAISARWPGGFVRPFQFLRQDPKPSSDLDGGISILLHPGSGSERKNWPVDFWCSLVEELMDISGLQLEILSGEAEFERTKAIVDRTGFNGVVHRSASLDEVVGIMERSCFYIGHDSGITHLAACCQLDGLVLWRHTSTKVWKPVHEGLQIVLEEEEWSARHLVERVRDRYGL